MILFEDIWALLKPEGEFKRRRGACERLWQGYGEARRQVEEKHGITTKRVIKILKWFYEEAKKRKYTIF